MEFYQKLTDLLKSARTLQSLEKLKESKRDKKEEYSKEFQNKLKPILKYKNLSDETRNFRKYWIKYLNKLIKYSFSYCTNKENTEIEDLINDINEGKDIYKDYENKNNIYNQDEIHEKNFLENSYSEVNNLNLNNINQLDILKRNLKNTESYRPSKYENISNENEEDEDRKQLNEIIDYKEEKVKNKNNNQYIRNNDKNKIDEFDFFNYDNNNIFINKGKSDDKKENINDKVINNLSKDKTLDNKNILKKNSEKIIQINEKKEIKNKEQKIPQIKEFNLINDSLNNNQYSNIIIKDNNLIQLKKDENNLNINNENKKPEIKILNQNNKKNKPSISKKEKVIVELSNELLDNKNDNNVLKIIFDSLFLNKKNLNSKIVQIFSFIKNNKNKKIQLEKLKEKLITLACILYPFSKGNKNLINEEENLFIPESLSEQNLYNFLSKSIIIKSENFKFVDFDENKIPYSINKFCKDLKIDSKNGKYEIYNAYTFLVISRNFRKYCIKRKYKINFDMLEKEFIISYKLRFVLEHPESYEPINEDFLEIYKGLMFIKIFYDKIFSEISIIQKDENLDNYVFGDNKFILSFDEYCDPDIKSLFIESQDNDKDSQIYDKVFEKIEYFFNVDRHSSIDIYNLIKYSTNKQDSLDNNFIFNLVELEQMKIENIYNDIDKYKNTLKSLEKDIFRMGKESLNLNYNLENISEFFINKEQKDVFESLLINIKTKIIKKFKDSFNLYPYGSVTQFLGNKKSDIDLYLYINKNIDTKNKKIEFLNELSKAIYKIIGQRPNLIISARLCVFSFNYGKNKVDFDISIMGFCPYLHSILLRTYSLIEPRFSLLANALKKFIEIIKIKSTENKNEFLNSFSWMILLITFLQDIIKPHILPKLLSDKRNSIINYPIPYGNNARDKKSNYFNKDIYSFINNIKEETSHIPICFFNKDKSLYDIYKENKDKSEKNELSCAEIFLFFLEFVIYYFKYDAVYVNCSIENECFESIKNILDFNDQIDKTKRDDRFYNYFKFKYSRATTYREHKKTRDGLILIRDPFDPHYNPGQSLKKEKLNIFVEHLKFGYLSLIKNGNFEILRREFRNKKNQDEENYQ